MIQICMSLLDTMSIQMGCAYLSDLRFLDGAQRGILAGKLERIPARAALIAALTGGQTPDFS